MSDENKQPPEGLRRSTRDAAALRAPLQTWLTSRFGAAAAPQVSEVTSPAANGLSSETLLFAATWRDGNERRGGSFVARVEPASDDCPVFPTYDLEAQFRLHDRRVHFGEAQRADDPDEPIFHRRTLERMIDGSWWQETSR